MPAKPIAGMELGVPPPAPTGTHKPTDTLDPSSLRATGFDRPRAPRGNAALDAPASPQPPHCVTQSVTGSLPR